MDANRNGAISNGEFIAAMSHTASGENPLSQSLLAMMDVNHDGEVSSNEYINLETQFVGAEKSTG
jgi:Ca2+-binding EF-hand superfamily protein